jgi:hypothetical protein
MGWDPKHVGGEMEKMKKSAKTAPQQIKNTPKEQISANELNR